MTRLMPERSFTPCCNRRRWRLWALLSALLVTTPGGVLASGAPVLMVLGDSLSAGYGIQMDEGWVHLLERRLKQRGMPHRVVNASISGDTTRGGAVRLSTALSVHQPDIVVVELGGNDGLRGLPLNETRQNLALILKRVAAFGAQALLVGMRLPPNYGPQYTEAFYAIYEELAEQFDIPLVPFLLTGVAEDPALMQADGIHPRAEGQAKMLENLWPFLEPMLTGEPSPERAASEARVRAGSDHARVSK